MFENNYQVVIGVGWLHISRVRSKVGGNFISYKDSIDKSRTIVLFKQVQKTCFFYFLYFIPPFFLSVFLYVFLFLRVHKC